MHTWHDPASSSEPHPTRARGASILDTLRQSIYSRLAGYEDVNDAERLSVDLAMRHVVGGRAALTDKHAASTSEVGHFETEILNTGSNLKAVDGSLRRLDRQGASAEATEATDDSMCAETMDDSYGRRDRLR